MFTGLIEEIGIVQGIKKSGGGISLTISAEKIIDHIEVGDSITIDGACQTVTNIGRGSFAIFASKITCAVTTLGSFKIGKRINLERALTLNSRLGGHIVQGHVDGMGRVKNIIKDENGIQIEIIVENELSRFLVEKGSVAVDGVSLTVVSLTHDGFVVYIIPETMGKTTLSKKKTDDIANIEIDILAKYVEKMLIGKNKDNHNGDMMGKLIDEGFI